MKLLSTLLLLLLPLWLHADVYKWVDENGNVHYGDAPQTGEAVQLQIDTSPTGQAPADSMTRKEMRQRVSDSLEEDRLAKQEEREKKKQERERRMKECNWLRDRQRRLQRASGLYKLDNEGNRVYISDAARKKTEQQLASKIKQTCG